MAIRGNTLYHYSDEEPRYRASCAVFYGSKKEIFSTVVSATDESFALVIAQMELQEVHPERTGSDMMTVRRV